MSTNSNHSAAPGTPQTPTKAATATVLGLIGAFLVALITAIQGRTDLSSVSGDEWRSIIIGAIVTSATTGYATWKVQNKAKVGNTGNTGDVAA